MKVLSSSFKFAAFSALLVVALAKEATATESAAGPNDDDYLGCSDVDTRDPFHHHRLLAVLRRFYNPKDGGDDEDDGEETPVTNIFKRNWFQPRDTPPSSAPTPAVPAPTTPPSEGNVFRRFFFPPNSTNIFIRPWFRQDPTPAPSPAAVVGRIGDQDYHEFEARVLVDFEGRPDSVTGHEKRALEDAYLETYAMLEERDDFELENVTILNWLGIQDANDTDSFYRRGLANGKNKARFTYIFKTKCRAKPNKSGKNKRQFGNAASGRGLEDIFRSADAASTHHYLREEHVSREEQEVSCDGCPTKEEFLSAYSITITELQEDGSLVNVVAVEGIAEQETVNCASQVTEFETSVDITFQGEPDTEPSQSELEALAAAFVDSYNSANILNGETCDLLFRVAVEAEFVGADADTLVGHRNLRPGRKRGHYKNKMRVGGKCRGCKRNTRLTGGSTSGRRALFHFADEEFSHRSRHVEVLIRGKPQLLNETYHECYCPIDPQIRPPTQEEFQEVFNDNIAFLVAEGSITTVHAVEEIIEDEPNSSQPSLPPSQSPTVLPSFSPTDCPSGVPSVGQFKQESGEGPSLSPTGLPSDNPTVSPSTSSPTSWPSELPNPAPSIPETPSYFPSTDPSSSPSSSPTSSPSADPSASPTASPTKSPHQTGTPEPTISAAPSAKPTISFEPSESPSRDPSASPSKEPSSEPTNAPSDTASANPTGSPSNNPTAAPSPRPSVEPGNPTRLPSVSPSSSPSSSPSRAPRSSSSEPSSEPSALPSASPSREPSSSPSAQPSVCGDECFYRFPVNVGNVTNGTIVDTSIALNEISIIQRIVVTVATTSGKDLRIRIISPTGDEYRPMRDTSATQGTPPLNAFAMGRVQGNGTLANTGIYAFVESGGTLQFTAPFSSPGEYTAESWGDIGAPYAAGDWRLRIADTRSTGISSIGRVTLRYCGVCGELQETSAEPSNMPSPLPSATPSQEPTRACTGDVFECPDGSLVGRDPNNNCNFFPCRVCTGDVMICPDGSFVGRDPNNNCNFFPCGVCTGDVMICPDGSVVVRDPNNDCEFYPCPTPTSSPTGNPTNHPSLLPSQQPTDDSLGTSSPIPVSTGSPLPTISRSYTEVGGILASDTIWTLEESPYGVASTVQVPDGVTLTIEAGVEVIATTGIEAYDFMFLMHGTIVALGTETQPITFDGTREANFFSLESSPATAFLDAGFCVFRSGQAFWGYRAGPAYFRLRNSTLTNLTHYSYIWYPSSDIIIEYNTFVNASGFSVGHTDANVSIRYNRFESRHDSLINYDDAWIIGWNAPPGGATTVTRNSFYTTEELAVKLDPGLAGAAIDARNNYWGTTDKTTIESMIFDKNDDITTAGFVPFEPYLLEPEV